jgi:hypothetical protein
MQVLLVEPEPTIRITELTRGLRLAGIAELESARPNKALESWRRALSQWRSTADAECGALAKFDTKAEAFQLAHSQDSGWSCV